MATSSNACLQKTGLSREDRIFSSFPPLQSFSIHWPLENFCLTREWTGGVAARFNENIEIFLAFVRNKIRVHRHD